MVKIGNFHTVWGDLQSNKNTELLFVCEVRANKKNMVLELVAKDIYNLFINDTFVSYGPSRTAKGYCRVERLNISSYIREGINIVSVSVLSNSTRSLHMAEGEPFFGVRILSEGKLIKDTKDFRCYHNTDRVQKVERISCQRGYSEVYNVNGNFPEIETKNVPCPPVLERHASYSENIVKRADYVLSGDVEIDDTKVWVDDFTKRLDTGEGLDAYSRAECDAVISKEFTSFVYTKEPKQEGLTYHIYQLPNVITGKFVIRVKAEAKTALWLTFDDLFNGEFIRFNRERIIHGLKWNFGAGEYTFYSQEVYSAKYIQLITDGRIQIQEVSVICVENPDVMAFELPPLEEDLRTIVMAARNSLAQNAYDLFTDCPTRERSGWLCDSYFMGKAEEFFTGQNRVENDFLENYLLYEGDLFKHKGIVPMCYPSQMVKDNEYIPAWILWYVLELEDYKKRTQEITFIERHRQRFLDILDFFKGYENEYGLLENLEGWVFVEWSEATDFVDGVNVPTNILYAEALRAIGEMMEMPGLIERARQLRQVIRELAFDGELYRDNAVRIDGQLQITENVSEFNQIVAAYFKIEPEGSSFYQHFKERFRSVNRELPETALFIGSVLRLMTLYEMKEYELVLAECKEHFYEMARLTGTIWELFGGKASCNHGFGAIVGKLICESVRNMQGGETYEKF